MATFVLVHGAWGGAHGFRHVRRLLRAGGHEVTTPSLTGVGERVHLGSPLVNLSTHIRDVVNHILYEDLDEITLVGFSYGGFVITGALEHIAERVKHLVCLDAFVPQNGDTPLRLVSVSGRSPIKLGEDWEFSGPVREYDDPVQAALMTDRRTSHPKGCFTEAVYLSQPLESFALRERSSRQRVLVRVTPGRLRSGGRPCMLNRRARGNPSRFPPITWLRATCRRRRHGCWS